MLSKTGAAVRYYIVPPTSPISVDANATAMVLALDSNGDIATGENRPVLLVVSGSAIGGGSLTLVQGIASTTIHNEIVELVTLSLVDISSTGLDSTSTQPISFVSGLSYKSADFCTSI